ncbi:hypothetical protein Y1Q_0017771 [Alligator mississippiensis]|uniref:Uncharacterized protein n=1 Tax=Alligator mississippiensis TaxID=8496 RepID=A0A151MJM4_ALLMI|nr:hypothetical protein Y1Q_0017771 [Alligator mississippiensis]
MEAEPCPMKQYPGAGAGLLLSYQAGDGARARAIPEKVSWYSESKLMGSISMNDGFLLHTSQFAGALHHYKVLILKVLKQCEHLEQQAKQENVL